MPFDMPAHAGGELIGLLFSLVIARPPRSSNRRFLRGRSCLVSGTIALMGVGVLATSMITSAAHAPVSAYPVETAAGAAAEGATVVGPA